MTDETARLVVAVDSTSAGKATDVLDAMTNSAGNAEDTVAALSKAFGPVAAEIARLTAAIDRQVSSYDSLAVVNRAVATANTQATKATSDQAKATEALGETSEQARDRIREMVQASLDQARADAAAIQATQKRGDATKSVVTDLNAQVAASQRAQQAAEDYRARSAASATASKQGAAGTDTQREALEKLLKQIDPTIAALERLDKLEDQLGKAKSAGLIGGDDFDRFATTIQKRRKDISDAGESVHGLGLNAAAARQELGTLITQLARGDISGFASSLGTAANNTGLLTLLLSPAALGAVALAGGIAAVAVAAGDAYSQEQRLNEAIAASGNFAGVTSGSFEKLASGISTSNGHLGEARDILNQLVASGRVGAEALNSVGQAGYDIAILTKKGASEAAQVASEMFDGTTASLLKANEQYHFLTESTYEQVKALEEQGKQQEAVRVGADAFHDAISPRIKIMTDQVYGLAKAWEETKQGASSWYETFKNGASLLVGTASLDNQIAALEAKQEAAQKRQYSTIGQLRNLFVGSSVVDLADSSFESFSGDDAKRLSDLKAQRSRTEDQADADRKKASDAAAAVSADQYIDRMTDQIDKAAQLKAALRDLDARYDTLFKTSTPDNNRLAGVQRSIDSSGKATFSGGTYDKLRADIETKYADKAGQSAAKALDTAEIAAEAAKFKSAMEVITSSYTNAQRELDTQHKAGALSNAAYYQQSISNLNKEEAAQESAIKAEIARLQQRNVSGAEAVKNRSRIADLEAQAAKVEADASSKSKVLSDEEAAAKDKAARAINAYVDALGRQEAAARADADLQVERLSMGDREFANMQRLIAIRRQGADEQVRLASQLSNKQIDQSAYDAQAQAQQASTDRLVQIEEDGQKRQDAVRQDWMTGARKSMADLTDQASDAAGSFSSFVSSVNGGLSDFFVEAATKGKASVKDFVSSVLTDMARLASNRLSSSLLSSALGLVTGSPTVSTTTSGSFDLSGGTYSGLGSFATSGYGSIWGGARAGGGSTSPNSAYRIAEQGPEVYKSAGGQSYLVTGDEGGSVSPMRAASGSTISSGRVNVTVHNYGGDSNAEASQSTDGNGDMNVEVWLNKVIDKRMQSNLANRNSPSVKTLSNVLGVRGSGTKVGG